MKSFLLSVFLLKSVFSFSQFQISSIDITTNDLVYDSNTDRIYVSIPSSNGSNGNSIGIINTTTNTLEKTIFIGSEPTILAVSDNGEYIYTAFSGASIVRRFNVSAQTAGLQFSLGSDSSTGSYYAEDIEVMPNNSTVIAVSRKNIGFTPRHEGIAIYDDNQIRSITTPDHTGSNKIEFTTQNSLIGFNTESTEYGLRIHSIDNSGVQNTSVTQNVLTGSDVDFIYQGSTSNSKGFNTNNNRIYSRNGKVVDVSNAPFVIGSFSNVFGPVVYDILNNLVCFANFEAGSISLKRYNPDTFLILDSFTISQPEEEAKNIITCGNNCYAFNTEDNKIVIIKGSSLAVPSIETKNSISIQPNPVINYVTIKNSDTIEEITILDSTGRLVFNKFNSLNKIYLGNLSSGVYFMKIKHSNKKSSTHKIIKK
jgi:hypothetical protein